MSTISVILADAQYLIRVGLNHILGDHATIKVIGEAVDEQSLLNLMDAESADVIIMDYNQPNNFSITTIKLPVSYTHLTLPTIYSV